MHIATGNRPFWGIFGEYFDSLGRFAPKKPEIARFFARLIRFKDSKRPMTEIKVYQIKSSGNKRVKEYQQAAEDINVAEKSISENLNQRPKAGEHLIPSSKVKERGRSHSKTLKS